MADSKEILTHHPWIKNAGAWFGGFLCFIGILALSFGLSPFITSIRKSMMVVKLPGSQTLKIKLPGAYIAVCPAKGLSPDVIQRLNDLEYSLTSRKNNELLEILKIPPKVYATEKREDHFPLFQFTVDKPGTYLLNSGYPYEMEGPSVQAFLIHTNLGYVRMELFVGVALFIVLGGLGLYFILRNNKSNSV